MQQRSGSCLVSSPHPLIISAPVSHPPTHPPTAGRLYLRIAADLHMCLSHRAVALQLLSPGAPQAPLFASHFLEVFRLIQGASPFRWVGLRRMRAQC